MRDLMLTAEANREVIVHRFVVEKVLLDHVAAITKAEDKVNVSVMGVYLQNVPKDWPSSDVHQRLRSKLCLFPQTRSQPPAKDNRRYAHARPHLNALDSISPTDE